MNLIFIYGPPAAGKMTVGRELAKVTGYRFFFNHLTVLAAKAIFPDAHGPFYDVRYTNLLHALRRDALSVAAEAGFDVIFTLGYSGAVDDAFVDSIVRLYTQRGGNVYFVELHAPKDILLRRVSNPDRAALGMGKMTDPKHLSHVLSTRDMEASVPYRDVLAINTSQVTPIDSVRMIMEHFSLPENTAAPGDF